MLANFRKVFRDAQNGGLYLGDVAGMHVFDPAALEADEVMMFGEVGQLVMRVIVAQVDGMDDAFCVEGFEGAIDGHGIDVFFALPGFYASGERVDNFLCRERPFRGSE